MTLSRAVTLGDAMRKGNSYDNNLKTHWINEVEATVRRLVDLDNGDADGYTWEDDQDTELLVPDPYSKLYWAYLCAMIDMANGEFTRYKNLLSVYNAFLTDYKLWRDIKGGESA